MNYRIYFLILFTLLLSCNARNRALSEDDKFIVGYWVPKKIEWVKLNSGDQQMDKLLRYADFTTLCFSLDQFDLISSTNCYSVHDDSIGFEFEPGIVLFRGKWEVKDSKIIVEHKFKFSGQYPTGKDDKLVRDTLVLMPNKSELIFKGQHFVKANRYVKSSIDKIEAYRVSDRY